MKEPLVVRDYLRDILEAMDKAAQFVGDFDLDSFRQDEKCSYAVIRCLEIVGEAAKKIPLAVRKKHNDIPWKHLAGMRDKLIHDYAGVDLEVVLKTVREDIPSIRNRLLALVEEYDQ